MKRILFVFCALIFQSIYSQTVTIGLLTDRDTPEVQPLLEQLKVEILNIIGQDYTVNFGKPLENNYSFETAKTNYQSLVNSDTDIILSFGVIDNIMLSQQKTYPKPVIVFGSVNSDFINLSPDQKTSEIDNINYIIAPLSYTKDLEAFNTLYDYKNLGIIIDDYLVDVLPFESIFDGYFEEEQKQYKIIPLSENGLSKEDLNGLDAVYIAGGFQFNDRDFSNLAKLINDEKLPSFSAGRIRDVELGVLATNQPRTNITQIFRRIALNVESIVSGTNASELPLFLDYKYSMTINYKTAEQIEYPLRYAMLGTADFIGGEQKTLNVNALSILDIMDGVLDDNLTLESSKMNIDLSEQDVKTSKSSYLPNLSSSISGIYIDPRVAELSNGTNPEFSTSGSLVLEQLLYSENASANIDIQKELFNAQKEVYNTDQLDALLNASVAYFNALILKMNTSIQNQNLQLTKRNLELAEQNFEAGSSGKSDVFRFRSQLAKNTQSLIDAGNELKRAYFNINQLMNEPISKEIDIEDAEISEGIFENYNYNDFYEILDDPKLRPFLIKFLVEEAKTNAPELKNIQYNLNANDRTYRLNTAGRFIPTVALQGNYNLAISQSGKGSTVPSAIPTVPDGTYNVGLNLTLPIFNQKLRNIRRQTAVIQTDQLTVEKENVELSIEKNVNDIMLELTGQIANIEISKIDLQTSQESLDLSRNAYKQGAIPVIQLIDAQNNFIQAQLGRATATYQYLLALMQLERSIGYFFLVHSETENQQFIQRINNYILSQN